MVGVDRPLGLGRRVREQRVGGVIQASNPAGTVTRVYDENGPAKDLSESNLCSKVL